MDDKIYIFVLGVSFFVFLMLSSNKKPEKKKAREFDELARELNEYISEYNILLSKFHVFFEKAQNTCTENEDIEGLEGLSKLITLFNNQIDTMTSLIDENTELLRAGNIHSLSFYLLSNGVSDMNRTIDKTKLIEANSIDYVRIRREREETRKRYEEDTIIKQPIIEKGLDPFSGCVDLESLNKRYKALAKAFHPDNGFGDNKSFLKIQSEYEKRKSELS